MITELSEEQKAKLPYYRDKWLKIGLSTETIDREKAKAAICHMYECAGLDAPKTFMFLSSPMQGAMKAAALKNNQVCNQVGDQAYNQVWDQVWDLVCNQVGDQVWDLVGDAIYGSHDTSWLPAIDLYLNEFSIGVQASGLIDVAKNCGWVWAFDGVAIITDRPDVISFDDENRLHCEDGPAIKYRDGMAIYMWHGTKIPAEWIENPASLTPKEVLTTSNIEVRAAGMEMLGWANMFDDLGAVLVDSDPDPLIGELYSVARWQPT